MDDHFAIKANTETGAGCVPDGDDLLPIILRAPDSQRLDVASLNNVQIMSPVAMAAVATALGLIPLLFDAFFIAMAMTIIAGLLFANVLTMVVVPVLYATLFRVEVG